jgi:hypothetical protein
MNINKNTFNYSWELIGTNKENDKDIIKYTCPAEAVGNIIEEIFKAMQGESSKPNEAMREKLKKLLDQKIISIDLIYKFTKIDTNWIEQFVQGNETESLPTESCISLAKLISAL